MGANGPPVPGERPPEEVAQLLPVIARVFDLDRGPPGLVRWVRRRLSAMVAPPERLAVVCRHSLLLLLARDLSGLLRPDDRKATVAVACAETVWDSRPVGD